MKIPKRLLLLALVAGSLCSQTYGDFRAGVGKVEITPTLGEDTLRGMNGELKVVERAHDSLYAKALVFETAGELAAIVTFDLIMMENDAFEELRRRLAQEIGIDQLVCTVTHTHGSGIPTPEYAKKVVVAGVEAARKAAASLAPAEFGVGKGWVDESYNRRKVRPDGSVEMLWNNSGREPTKPVDNDVGVISIRSRSDGEPIATLVNYSAHPVITMNFRELIISSDYPGALAAKLEKRIGGEVLFLLGAVGDINAYDAGMFQSATEAEVFAAVDRLAETLADEVEAVYAKTEYKSPAEVDLDIVKVQLALRAEGRHAEPSVEVNVATLVFGEEAALAFLPGEPFVELGLDLKRRSPLDNTFVVSQLNGHFLYFPTIHASREGGYGAESATTIEVGAGERLVNEAIVSIYYQLDLVKPLQRR